MGEGKANWLPSRRLLVRLRFPSHEPMVVEAELAAGFLERVWKLMLMFYRRLPCATLRIEGIGVEGIELWSQGARIV